MFLGDVQVPAGGEGQVKATVETRVSRRALYAGMHAL